MPYFRTDHYFSWPTAVSYNTSTIFAALNNVSDIYGDQNEINSIDMEALYLWPAEHVHSEISPKCCQTDSTATERRDLIFTSHLLTTLPPSHIHCSIPGSKLTFSTNLCPP